ncbi:MAG: radical SAM protein [Defluviitaleaceae bacterium]|nr:radical SAM protein [Defluviitaleaceae bacterium]
MNLPISCELNITNYCNLDCYFCSANCSSKKDFHKINMKNLDKIIMQLKRVKCMYVSISGGEPMIHPEFFSIVKKLSENEFIVTLTTNGTLINKETINHIISCGIKWVQISIHSFNGETCKKIMGSDVQSKIFNALDIVNSTEGVGISACIVKNVNNYNEINDISKYLKIKGIPEIIREEIPIGKLLGKKNITIDCDKEDLFNLYTDNRDNNFTKPRKFAITVEGDIVTCSELGVPLGNIFEHDLLEIWNKNKVIGLCKGYGEIDCLAKYYYHCEYIKNKVDTINNESRKNYTDNYTSF